MIRYPRLLINLSAIKHNAKTIFDFLTNKDISIIAVTKGVISSPEIVGSIASQGIEYIGDSRISNIKKVKPFYPHLKYVLLRIPMISEVEDVVKFADISLNSEFDTILALGKASTFKGVTHKIILMVDVGDRREGILPEDFISTVKRIRNIEGVKVVGVGANFACFGGVLPDVKNLSLLSALSQKVEDLLGYKLEFISGGSTSSIYLVKHNEMPDRINNLRIGTGILFGIDDIRDIDIEGTRKDTFLLEAEIIELKEKPSAPYGEIAKDAFGNVPHFEDKGIRRRAILGIGKQDVIFPSLHPLDKDIEVVGGSSDHMIVDVTNSLRNYKIGDIIKFKVDYPAMLYLFNSSYVEKIYIEEVDR